MSILGIDRITYGVDDVAKCRQFFLDWGLKLVREAASRRLRDLERLRSPGPDANDPTLPPAMESGPTLRRSSGA
jgi:hypothetical protein